MIFNILLILYFIYKIVCMTLYDLGGLEVYNQFSPFCQNPRIADKYGHN